MIYIDVKKDVSSSNHLPSSSWTLFLDRDGVLNKRIEGYIQRPEELAIFEDVPRILALCAKVFRYIIVVTNQQGIGKGLMSHEDLSKVHAYLLEKIQAAGGRIDAIYYAPWLASDKHPERKPNVGMGLKAKKQFPAIDFKKSIMVGDFPSDILFGKQLGMKTIWIPSSVDAISEVEPDEIIASLGELFSVLTV
jgi:D-glycero-D-manno-heptose 1,7-bisphosphate phosphatase